MDRTFCKLRLKFVQNPVDPILKKARTLFRKNTLKKSLNTKIFKKEQVILVSDLDHTQEDD